MGVLEAVQRDVDALGSEWAESSLAATALALGAELDGDNSATSKSMCAKALVDVMRELRSLAPAREEKDELSDLRARRDRRRGGSAPADSASS